MGDLIDLEEAIKALHREFDGAWIDESGEWVVERIEDILRIEVPPVRLVLNVDKQAVLDAILNKPAWRDSEGLYHIDDIYDAVMSLEPKEEDEA